MNPAKVEIQKRDDLKDFVPLIDLEEAGEDFLLEIEEESEEVFALVSGDAVIGIAYMENDDEPHLSLYVFKEHRNKGYGTAALKQIEQKYIVSSAKKITAIYAFNNDNALKIKTTETSIFRIIPFLFFCKYTRFVFQSTFAFAFSVCVFSLCLCLRLCLCLC